MMGGVQSGDDKADVAVSKKCGIVMPISAIDGCSETHWLEVMDILNSAIKSAGYEPRLVSNSNEVGVIHKNIIQNLYDDPIVVCDISGKNPNVMFELGMRLAFDKPTIIVKDDKTSYSFDTGGIQHVEYPRDLRFARIEAFQNNLAEKICATAKAAADNPNYTTFLKYFGDFKVAKIEKTEVSSQDYILDKLENISYQISSINQQLSSGNQLSKGGDSESMRLKSFAEIDDPILLRMIRRYGLLSVGEANRHLSDSGMLPGPQGALLLSILRSLDSRSIYRILKAIEMSAEEKG